MQSPNKLNIPNTLLRRVVKTIKDEWLITPEDSVLAAVSGGPDSVTLLHILQTLQPLMFCKLGVAHLNHCIRPTEADRDSQFVFDLCGSQNLPFHGRKIDVPAYARKHNLNLEEAGRICRYNFFKSLHQTEGYTKIALGHHADDNAEQVLMFLLRGSGPAGISGMPAMRENRYIRPLLQVTRIEIMEYIDANRLDYVSDSSNLNTKHTRNRIRHHLIPTLKREYNPKIITALNTLAAVIRDEDEWLAQETDTVFNNAIVQRKPTAVILSANCLQTLHQALVRRVLRKSLEELTGNLRRIRLQHIEAIRNLLEKEKGYRRLNLPGGILVEIQNRKLRISDGHHDSKHSAHESLKSSPFFFRYSVNQPQDKPLKITIAELKSYFKFSVIDRNISNLRPEAGQNTAFFDMDRLTFPLIIRNVIAGDRFAPLGLKGTQKLKKYFINTKVPRLKRKYIPVVQSGDQIIWIAGYRCSHFSRIRSETKRILKAEFSCLKSSND